MRWNGTAPNRARVQFLRAELNARKATRWNALCEKMIHPSGSFEHRDRARIERVGVDPLAGRAAREREHGDRDEHKRGADAEPDAQA